MKVCLIGNIYIELVIESYNLPYLIYCSRCLCSYLFIALEGNFYEGSMYDNHIKYMCVFSKKEL